MILVRIAVPDPEVGLGELGMETIDGGREQGFLASCRPEHGVQGNATVNPAGGVASEQGVGQGRQDEAGMPQVLTEHPAYFATMGAGQIIAGDATDQKLGDLSGRQGFEPGAHLPLHAHSHEIGSQLAIQNPGQRLGVLGHLGQHVVHFQHFHAMLPHLGDEIEMIALGLVDPHHIIEQQIVAVAWRQALMCQAGRTDHDLAQLSCFRMDAILGFFRRHDTLPLSVCFSNSKDFRELGRQRLKASTCRCTGHISPRRHQSARPGKSVFRCR
ncbi:hypothetical protein A8U91_00662 [Halomonas elongata]|uniref:Uncharacterized protein n=1 Tax=Halomonas elongata TaxID=2746 RepID=A0A1B8P221_HALEL|nr:hypothetical protein A8U91_00662 [Halomonas elongata]